MGMDVIGKNPASETGEYFRNNVWFWRPLWNYCLEVAPDLCAAVNGHYNDGEGLDADDARTLGIRLQAEIDAGRTAAYEAEYNAYLASLPRHDCEWCGGTGIRTDEVGISLGQPTQALTADIAAIVGRTHGTCNGCRGEGRRDDSEMSYPFSVDNVREFALFLVDSGGFHIW
jgi:hypothetical protein